MKILIEAYSYNGNSVKNILKGISNLRDVKGKVNVNYVGYFYNPYLKDCVFILPKVLLDEKEKVFGRLDPEEIINYDDTNSKFSESERAFIYELAVWMYRTIVVFDEHNPTNAIIRKQNVPQMSPSPLRKYNTFLDILLALQKFNRENQQLIFSVLKEVRSGYNKINWNKTINRNRVIVQDKTPFYYQVVNKKRVNNPDEELLIIYYSILNHIHEEYGFPIQITLGFDLIKGPSFVQYLNGMGIAHLRQIRYKYFSDVSLFLWDLCYAFFEKSKKIGINANEQEYLLATNFDKVFETIIDDLVGDPHETFPKGLVEQDDGKRVDHMYRYNDLIRDDANENLIYYIGDSKYYKQKTSLTKNSVYKQFTYARNVIQWNLNLFLNENARERKGHVKLRDDDTEGYNVIPNFFISATQEELNRNDNIKLDPDLESGKPYFFNCQFKNRLFDRDTLLIARYNVNFLFVISLYAQDNLLQKSNWKKKVREMFRKEIREMLEKRFDFYIMKARRNVKATLFLRKNFDTVLGKVFSPYENKEYYYLALEKSRLFEEENDAVLGLLRKKFDVRECSLGDTPKKLFSS